VVLEPIEKFGPNDKVVEVNFIDNNAIFRFGDDITGSAPLSGSVITIRYRIGGGVRGRIGIGQIDTSRQFTPLPPANAVVPVRFRNISPSSGGTDKESIDQAKKRAPRDSSLQGSIVTSEDYAQSASTFRHPVFGAINKAVATIRTSVNVNQIEIYALAEGPDGIPVVPSAGLKAGLATFFTDLNVLSDSIVVLDGAIKAVDIDMTIVVDRNADASVVKDQVELAITNFFDISRWDMGQSLFLSNFIEVIEAIDGVSYLDVHSPSENILPTGELASPEFDGIGFNEVIVEGNRVTNYFYEKSPPPGGVRKS